MARVVWRSSAIRELQEIADFIARDSPRNAERTIGRIVASTRRLHEFPRSGRVVQQLSDYPIRQIVFRNYFVFYRIEAETVVIVGVRHTAMDVPLKDLPHD